MKYLLDTMAVSELVRPLPDPGVRRWLDSHEPDLHLSVLTFGELHQGVSSLAEGKSKNRLRGWIASELPTRFEGRIHPIELEIAEEWGRLQARARTAGRPLTAVDGLLVATALVHRFVLVTRNTRDMAGRGIELENPWSS